MSHAHRGAGYGPTPGDYGQGHGAYGASPADQYAHQHQQHVSNSGHAHVGTSGQGHGSGRFMGMSGGGATHHVDGSLYQETKKISEGGFAFVYLVRGTNSGREYALKKITIK